MSGKSRRISSTLSVGVGDKLSEEHGYCRKCTTIKKGVDFYAATDKFLDTNGKFSVCKACVSDIFVGFLNSERDVKKAMFLTCKTLNIMYSESHLEAAISQLSTKMGSEANIDYSKLFGIYKTKLVTITSASGDGSVGTFEYNPGLTFNQEDEQIISDNEGEDFANYLKKTWGSGLSIDDYDFLESTLAEWQSTHNCNTTTELHLMKLICHAELDIRKARETGGDTKSMVKALQDLIKTSNLSPAQSSMSSMNKSQEALGVRLKEIEELEPLEWLEKHKNPFEDVDNLSQYLDDFIARPIRNLITGSRDFNIKSVDEDGRFDIEIREPEDEGDIL
ncbi:MAG: hypothetical protein WA061_02210 [Microgenomates group bacterium]